MADRLTQLQDTINQVMQILYFYFAVTSFILDFKCCQIHVNVCYFSKQNTFAIALVFYSSILHLVNSLVLIALVLHNHISLKKVMVISYISYVHYYYVIYTLVLNIYNLSVLDYAALFANLIARCAKDIDTLIESLPSEESSQELQVASLSRLEQENQQAGEQLEEVVRQGEALLQRIQAALQDIAQSQLDMQNPMSTTVINMNVNSCNIKQEASINTVPSNNTHQLSDPSPNSINQ